jgi:predicted Zn finger-like uncharacterized protein
MMENPGKRMIVECSQCHTKFKIADEKVTPRGVKVRCSKCKNMFVVKPDGIELLAEKASKEKAEGIPDDIFKAPTRVEPRSPAAPPSGKFPLPPPSVPVGAGPSLADKIDLDSDDPVPAPARLPEQPPLDEMPTMPSRPPPGKTPSSEAPTVTVRPPGTASKPNLGDSLFGDLSLDTEAKKPLVRSADRKPAAPSAAPKAPPPPPPPPADDDPFAGIDISAPPAPRPSPPAAEKSPPWAAPAPSAGPDPVSGEAVGKPTKDLFDDLGDPFAGIPSTGTLEKPLGGEELLPPGDSDLPEELAGGPPTVSPGKPPGKPAGKPAGKPQGRPQDDIFANIESSSPAEVGGAPSPAEAEDPFAGIDTSVPTDMPAAGMPASTAGEDPFSHLDTAALGADEDAGPMGLELDSEGRLTGEPLPEPPPPTKASRAQPDKVESVRPVPSAKAQPAPMAVPEPRKAPTSGVLWAYKVGFGLLALVVALLLFVAYRSGGKPDLASWSTYVRAFTGEEGAEEVVGDLEAVEVKNTAYRTRSGHPLLVVWGKVSNKTKAQKAAVVVSGQLLGRKGEELGKFAAPAGITFTPQEVFEMTDHGTVASAYRTRLETVRDLKIPPEGDVPFMLVFYDHPEEMEELRIRVLPKESEDPLRGLSPQTEPVTDGKETPGEGEGQEAAKLPRGKTPPSSAGVVVKKTGTIVRLKPNKEQKPGAEAEEENVEEIEDVPVEVVEDEDVEEVE